MSKRHFAPGHRGPKWYAEQDAIDFPHTIRPHASKSPEIVALQSLDLDDIESRLDPLRPDRAADVTNEEVAHLLCIARDYDAGATGREVGGPTT